MEQWNEIRRKVLVEGVSKRQVCREYGLGWQTLEKMLGFPEPPGYRRQVPRGRPRLGPFVGLIDGILAADADPSTPRKQRHTARRIYERLRDEHGYAGSEVTVRRYVAEQVRVSGEVFVPLSQPAGEAQFDFGEATVEIAGVRVKAALAVMMASPLKRVSKSAQNAGVHRDAPVWPCRSVPVLRRGPFEDGV